MSGTVLYLHIFCKTYTMKVWKCLNLGVSVTGKLRKTSDRYFAHHNGKFGQGEMGMCL